MNFKRRGFLQAASVIFANPKAAVQKTLEAVAASTAAVAPALIDKDYMGLVIGKILKPNDNDFDNVVLNNDGSMTVEEANYEMTGPATLHVKYSKDQVRSSISKYLLDQHMSGSFADIFRGKAEGFMGYDEIDMGNVDIRVLDRQYDGIIKKTFDTIVSKVGIRNLVRSFIFDYDKSFNKDQKPTWKEYNKNINKNDIYGIQKMAEYYEPLGKMLAGIDFENPAEAIKQLRQIGAVKPVEAHNIVKKYESDVEDELIQRYGEDPYDYDDDDDDDDDEEEALNDKAKSQDQPDQSDPDWYDNNQDDPFMKTKERFHESTKITPDLIARFITEDPRVFNENEWEFFKKIIF